jgi:uncharacterized protein YgbK (DUF1537 family)
LLGAVFLLVILADDLTGTLDAAAPFAGRGLRTEIVLSRSALGDALALAPDVLSINVRSREVAVEDAVAATEAILSALPSDAVLFKKVDSRLKGHIAAELDVTPFRSALVAPAIPDFGRIVENGHVTGFGVESPIPVAARLGRHAERATVPDTASRAHLAAALETALSAGADLLVGARGLAEALALVMTNGRAAVPVPVPPGTGLFVIGSRDPITLSQVERLRATHAVRDLAAPNGLLQGAVGPHHALTLVQAVPGEGVVASDVVARHLADSVYPACILPEATLVLSGGATAEAVLDAMGIHRFTLLGECMPGLGVAFAGGHCIVAKSGGFGGPGTLAEIATQLVRNGG